MLNFLKGFKFNEDGTWEQNPQEELSLLKAESPKKKNGTLKAKYKDMPRYRLILIWEEHFRKSFKNTIKETNKEVFQFLKQHIK